MTQTPARPKFPMQVDALKHDEAFAVIDEALARHGGLTDAFVIEGSNEETPLYTAMELVLKGREMALPEGASFTDKDGHVRSEARVRWFDSPEKHRVATYTLPCFDSLPDIALPADVIAEARPYPQEAPPIFFGHYWLEAQRPARLAANVACLDYSVAKGGFLCAYRFDGEAEIDERRFEAVFPSER